MPQQQSLATWFMVNAVDDVSPSGMADVRTGEPIYAGGLNVGDYFDLTESEANGLSNPDVSILHSGRYRRVQVTANATAANLRAGRHGTMNPMSWPDVNTVTTSDLAPFFLFRPVIFLNTVTPGNYCFIQELGIANLWFNPETTSRSAGIPLFASIADGSWTATAGSGAGPYAILLDSVPANTPMLVRAFLTGAMPVLQG